MKDLERLQESLGYRFRDLDLLRLALVHPSADPRVNFQRLEFLGDSVLGLVISDYLFRYLSRAHEGVLTRLKSYLVSRKVLRRVAEALDLAQYVVMRSEATSAKVLADAMEAIVGAVYLDGGFVSAYRLVERLWAGVIEALTPEDVLGPKERLQLLSQAKGNSSPKYSVLDVRGPSHRPEFEVGVYIDGRLVAIGKGTNRKNAETSAAKIALEKMEAGR